MTIKKLTATVLLLALSVFSSGAPPAPVPRRSPELIITEPSGKQLLLSSFRGKVVVIEFFFLRSAKCINLVNTMNKLNAELGPRGFQAVAIAFPAPGSDATAPLVAELVDGLKLTYPVGYTNKERVDQYLERAETELLRIPQVVVIDREGMVRAQSGGRDGNVQLENEGYLRSFIEGLLESSPRASTSPTRR
jgi:peroxiredoxin